MFLTYPHALFKDDDTAWVVYLTLAQVRNVLLCFCIALIGWRHYPLRIIAMACAIWYLTQAIDEALAGNFWDDGKWENGILAAWSLAITWHLYERRKKDKGKLADR